MPKSFTVAIAGSTHRTALCARSLVESEIPVSWVLTPKPKPIGRKHIITKNPLHLWAEEEGISQVLIEKRLDAAVRAQIEQLPRPDILLVVDFGYLIPDWMIAWPTAAPLNIHPSHLPRWRGSSPAQFCILFGETQSAVCIMELVTALDAGPVLASLPFAVEPDWTQTEYYQKSFSLASEALPQVLHNYMLQKITPIPQPEQTPTPVARRLEKADSFVEWNVLQSAMNGLETEPNSQLLRLARPSHSSLAQLLEHAVRAFSPWPQVWTIIPTQSGEKRMQILSARVTENKLELLSVKIEGKSSTAWGDIQQTVV